MSILFLNSVTYDVISIIIELDRYRYEEVNIDIIHIMSFSVDTIIYIMKHYETFFQKFNARIRESHENVIRRKCLTYY